MPEPEIEKAIDEALGGGPRAGEIAEMIAALEGRSAALARDAATAASEKERRSANARRRAIERRIADLRREQVVAQFAEDSVRLAAARAALREVIADDV